MTGWWLLEPSALLQSKKFEIQCRFPSRGKSRSTRASTLLCLTEMAPFFTVFFELRRWENPTRYKIFITQEYFKKGHSLIILSWNAIQKMEYAGFKARKISLETELYFEWMFYKRPHYPIGWLWILWKRGGGSQIGCRHLLVHITGVFYKNSLEFEQGLEFVDVRQDKNKRVPVLLIPFKQSCTKRHNK